jgi:hypothetical protein
MCSARLGQAAHPGSLGSWRAGGDLDLEAVLDIIRQAPLHAVLHLVLEREQVEGPPEQRDDFGLVVGRRASEEFDANLVNS